MGLEEDATILPLRRRRFRATRYGSPNTVPKPIITNRVTRPCAQRGQVKFFFFFAPKQRPGRPTHHH